MPYLDDIYKELKRFNTEGRGTFSLSDGNRIEIVDTPRMWGTPFNNTDKITKSANEAVGRLANIIRFIIWKAEDYIDIVSLAPPEGVFYDAIVEELTKHFSNKDSHLSLVRFLFGYLPGGEDTVEAFRTKLANSFGQYKNLTLSLYVGRVHGGEKGGGAGPLSPWNHSKIVAADGKLALVGGHNLWPVGYGEYPPVHDLSLFVTGPAAKSAQDFATFMWTLPGQGIRGRPKWTRYYQFDFKKSCFLTSWGLNDTVSNWKNFLNITEQLPLLPENSVNKNQSKYESLRDIPYITEDIKVLGVGRFPTEDKDIHSHAKLIGSQDVSPSDKAKEFIIKSAEDYLYISQQDIVFLGSTKEKDHLVVGWIAEALFNNDNLQVMIAVSPINAKSKDGAQYSWGSGALGTYEVISNRIKTDYQAKSTAMLKRLHVAPFCFTNVAITPSGQGYSWPDTKRLGFKSAQFSTIAPLPRLYHYQYPEPANHSKFYMAVSSNNSVYYVGSDNLYPHNLFEFGYLVDDSKATKTMYDEYWNKLWGYSQKNCVCPDCRRSAYSILIDSKIEYLATLDTSFRSPSEQSRKAVDLITKFVDAHNNPQDIEDNCKYIIFKLLNQEKVLYKTPPEGCQKLNFPKYGVGRKFREILVNNIEIRYGAIVEFAEEPKPTSQKSILVSSRDRFPAFINSPSVQERFSSTLTNSNDSLTESIFENSNLIPKKIFISENFFPIPQELGVEFIPGDGNCLFRAVSEACNNKFTHTFLRNKVCDYIQNHLGYFKQFEITEEDISKLRKNGGWGGHAEIQVLSIVLNRKIVVYQPDRTKYMETSTNSSNPDINLLLCNFRNPKQQERSQFNHFNLINSLDKFLRPE